MRQPAKEVSRKPLTLSLVLIKYHFAESLLVFATIILSVVSRNV